VHEFAPADFLNIYYLFEQSLIDWQNELFPVPIFPITNAINKSFY
jgi:hypothetical protein